MGACTSSNGHINSPVKGKGIGNKYDDKIQTVSSKEIQSGEIYYLQHKTADFQGNVIGGMDKVQLFFALKIENYEIINGLNQFQMIKVKMLLSADNEKSGLKLVGETEDLEEGSLKFHTTFFVDYFFEKNQILKFEIKNNDKIIDTIETTLGRLMGARGQNSEFSIKFPFSITNISNSNLLLLITANSVKEKVKNTLIHFDIQTTFFNYNDYFVIISNGGTDNFKSRRVYKSSERQGKDIVFAARNLNLNDICFGDNTREIVFDFYNPSSNAILGNITTTLDVITYNENMTINNSKGVQIGSCRLFYETQQNMKFVEYLEKGLQISLIVGVDYTASNGVPTDYTSLHFLYGKDPNHYEQAIRSCGSVVADYDFDQKFPVYGFGGIVQGETKTNHCFNCNLSSDPNVDGIEGIISTYRKSLNSVELDGPTYFHPLIKKIEELVKFEAKSTNSSIYYILLMLTDGKIHDMDMTRDVICEAATLPISIVIIGIGEDDFSNMVELDGDTLPLTNKKGEKIQRDIVQFVKFNDFKENADKLAEEVLCEIPKQVEQYYKQYKNFKSV